MHAGSRSAILLALSFCAAGIWLPVRPLEAAGSVAWPQTYRNAGHTNFNAGEITLSTSNVSSLELLWGQSVPCGVLGFALNAGTIYAEGQGSGCNTPDLEAIDASTGVSKWTITTDQDGLFLQGTVAVAGYVFAGCGFSSTQGRYGAICAYRKSNGHRVWQWSSPCNCLPESQLTAPLVYANSTIYFGYGNGGGTCGGDTNYIVAADAQSGSTRWTYVTGGCGTLGDTAPAIADGHVYFEGNGSLIALSQTDGSYLWSVPFGSGSIEMGLTALNGIVYDNVDNNGAEQVVAFDGATGSQLWTFPIGSFNAGSQTAPPAIGSGRLYVTGIDHQIYALRASDGGLKWSDAAGTNSPPSVANGVLYVDGGRDLGGAQPSATAYNASNGSRLWETSAPGSTLNPGPMVANGTVYITNAACGTVCAYALPGAVARRGGGP